MSSASASASAPARASAGARTTERIPLSVHLVAGALATLGALAMLAALPLPSTLDRSLGALLIAAATLLVTWANRRHGRGRRTALSLDVPSALCVVVAISLALTVVLFPHDSPVAVRVLIALVFGAAFLATVRWEDRTLARRASQESSGTPPAPTSDLRHTR